MALKGADIALLAFVVGPGSSAAYDTPKSDSIPVTIKKEFGDFAESTENNAVSRYATPQGKDGSDKRWIPGVDGLEGFNLEAIIDTAKMPDVGVYTVTIVTTGADGKITQRWEVSVSG